MMTGCHGSLTFQALGFLGNLDGIVGWEDAAGPSAHVVALVPVILRLHFHQQWVVNFQLQLIAMAWDKPEAHSEQVGSDRGGKVRSS